MVPGFWDIDFTIRDLGHEGRASKGISEAVCDFCGHLALFRNPAKPQVPNPNYWLRIVC